MRDSNILLNFCSFSNCSSNTLGGCVGHFNGESIHRKICCINCSTGDDGAYLYNQLSDEKGKRNYLFDCSISETKAESDTSLWIEKSKIEMKDINSSYNYAGYNPFCVIRPGEQNVANTTFCDIYNNSAPGQGIFWSYGVFFEIVLCQFLKNSQYDNEGALVINNYGSGKIQSSIFSFNDCYKLFYNGNIKVYDCHMKSNDEKVNSNDSIVSTIQYLPYHFDKYKIHCNHYNFPSRLCIYPHQCSGLTKLNLLSMTKQS